MKYDDMFLKNIQFSKVFRDIIYIPFKDEKGRETTRRIQLFSWVDNGYPEKLLQGVIIGHCIKYDGDYYPASGGRSIGFYSDYDDYEPGALLKRKRVRYWRVVTAMNIEYLVPMEPDKETWRMNEYLILEHFGAEFEDYPTPENQLSW